MNELHHIFKDTEYLVVKYKENEEFKDKDWRIWSFMNLEKTENGFNVLYRKI